MMQTIRRLYYAIIWLFLLARSTCMNLFAKFFGIKRKVTVATWRVDRAYVFRDPPLCTHQETDDVIEIPQTTWRPLPQRPRVDFSDPEWKTSIDRLVPTSWTSWRIELICTKKSSTRRLICRRDETMHFPGDVANIRSTRLFPRAMVRSATVKKTSSTAYAVDVTDQLAEYVICKDRKFHPKDLLIFGDQTPWDDFFLEVVVQMPNGSSRRGQYAFSDPSSNIVNLFTL